MDKQDLLTTDYGTHPELLAEEISKNHPLLTVDLLLLVNSELFSLDKEAVHFLTVVQILEYQLVRERIREYCQAKMSKYGKDLLRRYSAQKESFSEELNEKIVANLSRASS